MKGTIHRILQIISSAIFVILVLLIITILAYVVRVRYLANAGRLGEVKLNFYTILTQSMYPTIKAGDVVITYKHNDNVYKKGDIITFVSNMNGGINITHRVEKVYKNTEEISYKTKGDNNNVADTEITKGSNVLGKVVVKLPKVGYVQQFLVTKTGWIIAIVLPAFGIIIYDILKIFKAAFKKTKKIEETEEVIQAKENLNQILNSNEEKTLEEIINQKQDIEEEIELS